MIVSVCVIVLTALDPPPRSKGYFVITMVGFVLKGGGVNTRRDIYIRKIESKCNAKPLVKKVKGYWQ